MLQPRLLVIRNARNCRCLTQTVRTYATVSEVTPTNPSGDLPIIPGEKPSKNKEANKYLRSFVPRTPGVRHLRQLVNDHLWRGRPYKPLTFPKKGQSRGGRNNTGRVTVRHRGGGHKRRIRTIDYERKDPGPQLVERIEYDPNRSAHIAFLTHKETGKKSYIIAPVGLRAGDSVESYRAGLPKALITDMGGRVDPGVLASKTIMTGNCLPMQMVPPGTQICCVGSADFRGAVFCRSAGTSAIVIGKDLSTPVFKYMVVRLQSGEVRKVAKNACATIGVASNPMWHNRQLGKAGRSRWLGIRPTVRGVAMNACDHPHGGGRGKSKGNRAPVSPWGQPAKSGYKTRVKNNINTWVVKARERNHGKRRSKS